MMRILEKLSPRQARLAIFFILLIYIFATSSAKPMSPMDKSEVDDVWAQNGDSDLNHQVVIPTYADLTGVPVENILQQPDIERLHRYPRAVLPPNIRCLIARSDKCLIDTWSAAMRDAEIGIRDD